VTLPICCCSDFTKAELGFSNILNIFSCINILLNWGGSHMNKDLSHYMPYHIEIKDGILVQEMLPSIVPLC